MNHQINHQINSQLIHIAVVILYQNNKFLMQLRDNIPNIISPGCWGLFGGHLEPGETPEKAVQREVMEEINYELTNFAKFDIYADEKVVRHVYHAPLLVELNQLVLHEGWDMALLTSEEILLDSCYSIKAGEIRPFAPKPHKIMIDFINSDLIKSIQ
jgi:8-oxo-dGTP diphosphatase